MKNILKRFSHLALGIHLAFGIGLAGKLPTEAQQQASLLKVEKKWAAKLGVTIPVKFAVKPEVEMLATYIQIGGHPFGEIYGLSGPEDEKGETGFVWIMRLQDYPEWADAKKIKRDQVDSVVHELVHLLYHTWGSEAATARTADLLIKGKIDK